MLFAWSRLRGIAVGSRVRLVLVAMLLIAGLRGLGLEPTAGETGPGPVTVVPAGERMDPGLAITIDSLLPDQKTTVIVRLKAQVAAEPQQRPGVSEQQGTGHLQRFITERQELARASQQGLLGLLSDYQKKGKVDQVVPFWIFNGLAVTATPDVLGELADRPEVAQLSPDRTFSLPAPQPVLEAESVAVAQPNIDLIGAPPAWRLGARGQGVVVASLDTGVDVGHPDLQFRWRGGSNSWFDPYGEHPTTPADLNGHGTQVMGIMVGDSADGKAIGVAPDAQWIAAKIFGDDGEATTVAVHQAFQWLLDPDGNPATADAPQIVNNSWAEDAAGCDLEFLEDVQALESVGIAVVFAGGNYGPSPASSPSPGNYPGVLAVGATNSGDTVASFSSRGPASCGGPSRIYPDVTAPGVSILSSDLYGGYKRSSGTSFAAPHASGALAILRSLEPSRAMAGLTNVLARAAVDLGLPGPDNDYGSGRIDLTNALCQMPTGQRWQCGSVLPGETMPYTFTLQNMSLVTDTFAIDGASDLHWQLQYPVSATVGPEESRTFNVSVTAPPAALPGLRDTTIVTATSTNGGDPLLATAVTAVSPPATFNPISRSGAILPGGTGIYTYTLNNALPVTSTYTLTASSEHGWPLEWSPAVTVGPMEAQVLTVAVTAPSGTIPGLVDTSVLTATLAGGWATEARLTILVGAYRSYFPLIRRGVPSP